MTQLTVEPNYKIFSHDVYVRKIYPVIKLLETRKPISSLRGYQSYYCSPDEQAKGIRLYPSALTVLAYMCINPQSNLTDSVFSVAAAVELYHNYSLVHDDVFDEHLIRRNRDTVIKKKNEHFSILVGNNMIGDSLILLQDIEGDVLQKLIYYYGKSISTLNLGQAMDEGCEWAAVSNENAMNYWWEMSEYKLAVGIFAVEASAILQKRDELIAPWHEFEKKISLISQVMNDTGDVFNYAGFYATEPSKRKPLEEANLKTTLPFIWLAQKNSVDISTIEMNPQQIRETLYYSEYLDYAKEEVEQLRDEVRAVFNSMSLPDSEYKSIFLDYIEGPKIPENISI